MDREIKFRAWNGNIMEYSEYDDGSGSLYDFFADYGTDYDDRIYMQYTGLKDKRGQEIYEGDILDTQYRWLVVFRVGCFIAEQQVGRPKGSDPPLWRLINERVKARDELEIIGNMYENPELI